MVRIKDIALKAKVSSATVSRILNEDESLSVAGETRQRVINIAEELLFLPAGFSAFGNGLITKLFSDVDDSLSRFARNRKRLIFI